MFLRSARMLERIVNVTGLRAWQGRNQGMQPSGVASSVSGARSIELIRMKASSFWRTEVHPVSWRCIPITLNQEEPHEIVHDFAHAFLRHRLTCK
jgi:hypothetical protein